MKTIDQQLLDEVANRLANELHPDGIWLFGSHAWGTPDEGSDLDLLVATAANKDDALDERGFLRRCRVSAIVALKK